MKAFMIVFFQQKIALVEILCNSLATSINENIRFMMSYQRVNLTFSLTYHILLSGSQIVLHYLRNHHKK